MSWIQAAKESFLHPQFGWKSTNFWGPIANWGIVLSAVYDATTKGPETISPVTTAVLIAYSSVFTRFATQVKPANPILFACHTFNLLAQGNQLRRWYTWHNEQTKIAMELPEEQRQVLLTKIGSGLPFDKIATAVAVAGTGLVLGQKVIKPLITRMNPVSSITQQFKSIMLHPAGPFFIHFWAPLFKWSLSLTNILEWDRDLNLISLPQQTALALTGFIWSRYSLVISPKNWSLFLVNFVLGLSSSWHIGRKLKAEMAAKDAI